MNLSEYDKKILDALDTVGGFTTGGVAMRVTPKFGNNRQHSGAIRSWLVNLEKKGLVKRMDDQKPVCWMKVSNVDRVERHPRQTACAYGRRAAKLSTE